MYSLWDTYSAVAKMKTLKVYITGILLIFLIFLTGLLMSENRQLFYISSFGFLALLSIIFVLLIPLFFNIRKNKFTLYLITNRRWIGIYTFIFALIHVTLIYLLLFEGDFIRMIGNFYRGLGLVAFVILLIMVITSNNFSVSILGKYWKIIHYFIYLALILVIIHSFNIGKIFMKNTIVQIIIALLVLLLILGKIRQCR